MVDLAKTISIPLVVTDQGTIRIKGSRVSLDSIVHHFKLGATAEQIVYSFPSLHLGDVYSSIAYYLTHRPKVEAYLEEQEVAGDDRRLLNYGLASWAAGANRQAVYLLQVTG